MVHPSLPTGPYIIGRLRRLLRSQNRTEISSWTATPTTSAGEDILTILSVYHLLGVIRMSELFEALIPELRARFPGRGLRIEAGPPQRAVFPAIHPEVGDLAIEDDEQELTAMYGNFTHCHYGPYRFSPGTTVRVVIDSLLSDIDDLFSNRLIMWGSHDKSGGLFRFGEEATSLWEPGDRRYVWSGPL